MQLEIFFNAEIDFKLTFETQQFDMAAGIYSKIIEYIPMYDYGKQYNLSVSCHDPLICTKNVKITKIIFDEFWELEGTKVAIGKNVYSNNYIPSSASSIDYTVNDNNVLFFTGELIYTFYHPIQDFIHALH